LVIRTIDSDIKVLNHILLALARDHDEQKNEMSNLYRGPPIDASYQVSYHLAKRFRGKAVLEIDQ
jgi:hypothetical protein